MRFFVTSVFIWWGFAACRWSCGRGKLCIGDLSRVIGVRTNDVGKLSSSSCTTASTLALLCFVTTTPNTKKAFVCNSTKV